MQGSRFVERRRVYGVVWIKARAEVGKAAGIVTLNDIKITKEKFPITAREAEYLSLVRSHISTAVQSVALDHLESSHAARLSLAKETQFTSHLFHLIHQVKDYFDPFKVDAARMVKVFNATQRADGLVVEVVTFILRVSHR